jgi:hypothetical protein
MRGEARCPRCMQFEPHVSDVAHGPHAFGCRARVQSTGAWIEPIPDVTQSLMLPALPRETSPFPVSGHSIFLRVMQCTLFIFLAVAHREEFRVKEMIKEKSTPGLLFAPPGHDENSEDRDRFARKSLTFEAGYYKPTYRIAIHEMQSSGLSYYIIPMCIQPGADEEPHPAASQI